MLLHAIVEEIKGRLFVVQGHQKSTHCDSLTVFSIWCFEQFLVKWFLFKVAESKVSIIKCFWKIFFRHALSWHLTRLFYNFMYITRGLNNFYLLASFWEREHQCHWAQGPPSKTLFLSVYLSRWAPERRTLVF